MWNRIKRRGRNSEALAAARAEALLETTPAFLAEHSIKREATLDTPLAEPGLGLDSIQRMDLLATIEKQCDVTVPEALWADTPVATLRELLAHLDR